MLPKGAQRERILPVLEDVTHHGRITPAALDQVRRETGVPAADVHGVASFYTLLGGEPRTRVCQGLTCKLAGSDALLASFEARGEPVQAVSCLGQCDRAPAALDPELEVVA